MSNEITLTNTIAVLNGAFNFPRIGTQYQVNQTVAGGGNPGTLTIGTASYTVIDPVTGLGLTAAGFMWIKNLDPTNYLIIAVQRSGPVYEDFAKVKPGEEQCFRLYPGKVYGLKANTLAVKVQAYIFED